MSMEISHLWIGFFPSEEEFENYFQERSDDAYGRGLYRTSDDDDGDDEEAADAELHEEETPHGINEDYADTGDELPINKFSEEQGETFYDDDRVERSFNDSGDLRALLAGHSNETAYAEHVIAFVESQGIGAMNSFILADKDEFESPRSVHGDGYTLWYIGEFSCLT